MRIVFMGTPDFAVASLQRLLEAHMNVVAVITAPDKPTGRGQKMNQSAVKIFALKHNIPVLQPEKLRNKAFLEELKSYNADLQVVVAFRMLPEVVWAMPPKGTINLHGSLLPQYRGAAPINRAIINGEKYTGATTFFIEKEIDTGNIIDSVKIEIGSNDTAGDLHDKMMWEGADLLVKTVKNIAEGKVESHKQQFEGELKSAPKIFRETAEIDWIKSPQQQHNFIRGLSPYPAAWTTLEGKQLKIFETQIYEGSLQGLEEIHSENMLLFTDFKDVLIAATGTGFIEILSLQLEGKKRMKTEEFLRGYRF